MITMITCYEAAAMVAESNGANETAAWLREQGKNVSELIEADKAFDAAQFSHVGHAERVEADARRRRALRLFS